jgi:hypothetical protein
MALLLQSLRDVRIRCGDPDMLPPLAQQPFIGLARGADVSDRRDVIRRGIVDARTHVDAAVNKERQAKTNK